MFPIRSTGHRQDICCPPRNSWTAGSQGWLEFDRYECTRMIFAFESAQYIELDRLRDQRRPESFIVNGCHAGSEAYES